MGVHCSKLNIRDKAHCFPCLCSKIGTPPPDYDYSPREWRPVREIEREREKELKIEVLMVN